MPIADAARVWDEAVNMTVQPQKGLMVADLELMSKGAAVGLAREAAGKGFLASISGSRRLPRDTA